MKQVKEYCNNANKNRRKNSQNGELEGPWI